MNTDISEIVSFVSNNLSRIHATFNRIGFADKGKQFLNDEEFEAMMQESVDFLCADSSVSLEARKSALHYQTDQVLSFLERSVVAPEFSETYLKFMDEICGENFISGCAHRAQLIENVLQRTLNNQIQSAPQSKPKSSLGGSV